MHKNCHHIGTVALTTQEYSGAGAYPVDHAGVHSYWPSVQSAYFVDAWELLPACEMYSHTPRLHRHAPRPRSRLRTPLAPMVMQKTSHDWRLIVSLRDGQVIFLHDSGCRRWRGNSCGKIMCTRSADWQMQPMQIWGRGKDWQTTKDTEATRLSTSGGGGRSRQTPGPGGDPGPKFGRKRKWDL